MKNELGKYKKVLHFAEKWGMPERTVRNYCASGKISGVKLVGKTWYIPENAKMPDSIIKTKKKKNYLLERLLQEKKNHISGGAYHKIQIDLTYNSNHIEGSKLTHEETRYIFETKTIGRNSNVDDIVETVNHFKCVDICLENANYKLSETFIKKLHMILKNGTSDSRISWFKVGDYKKLPNEVDGKMTTKPENVSREIKKLLLKYKRKAKHSFEEIISFHYEFEMIHPFQDGNGRIGRLILFKECLKNNIVPFIITDELKFYYYRGLDKWKQTRGYLIDTCLAAQDEFKKLLDYYRIKYNT